MDFFTTGLSQEDKYVTEINLEDMESTLGKCQEYWLLVIKTLLESPNYYGDNNTKHTTVNKTANGRALFYK